MTRIGPNQDINNPTTLEQLRYQAETASVLANDHNNANNDSEIPLSINPSVHPDNSRLIPITTLLRKSDGSEIMINGFTTEGNFTPTNLELYTQSVIHTYIDQAERFRDYYNQLVAIANTWSDRDNGPVDLFSSVTERVTYGFWSWNNGWATSNIHIEQDGGYITIDKSQLVLDIIWSGHQPVSYNVNTYPQLMNVFEQFNSVMQATPIVSQAINTDKTIKEIAAWTSTAQGFVQTSDQNADHWDLLGPDWNINWRASIPMGSTLGFPILISNTNSYGISLPFTLQLTMSPRSDIIDISQSNTLWVIKKEARIYGPEITATDYDKIYIPWGSSDISEAMNAIVSDFSIAVGGTLSIAPRSIEVAYFSFAFVNQLYIQRFGGDLYPDWETGELLSNINVQMNIDGHTINKTFSAGLVRDMWA